MPHHPRTSCGGSRTAREQGSKLDTPDHKAAGRHQLPDLWLTSSCWLVCGVVMGIQASWRVEGSCVLLPTLCHAGGCGLITICPPLTVHTRASREEDKLAFELCHQGEAAAGATSYRNLGHLNKL